jgi:hypothetical protein
MTAQQLRCRTLYTVHQNLSATCWCHWSHSGPDAK